MDIKKAGGCPNPEACGWIEGSLNDSQLQLQPRSTLKQKYLIGKVLGQGGFGITYLSYDLNAYRKLAIKEYFPISFATRTKDRHTVTHSSPDNRTPYEYGLNKFTQEAKTLERLRGHANIVSVMEFFPANNTAYIVMEYLDGITLERYVRGQPDARMSFEHTLRILVPVMDALREVHREGLVHRDVSPDNIILTKSAPVKLIDFGAAKQAAQTYKTQQLILKPGYTPEEQYRSDGIAGPYTDVYSTGATFYRCLTGVVPPEAPVRMYDDTLTPPNKFGAGLSTQAENAILRALGVRSKDRYQTIAEFQRHLVDHVTKPDTPDATFSSPHPVTTSLKTFRVWWTAALVSMFLASFSSSVLKISLLIIGAVAFALSGRVIGWRNDRSRHEGNNIALDRPQLALILLAIFSMISVTLFPAWAAVVGALLMIPGAFVGSSLIKTRGAALSTPSHPTSRPIKITLRFTAGDEMGETVEVGSDPIIIGRDPRSANLIVRSPHVSGAHVKVSLNKSGDLNIEDLNSRNGSYIRRSTGDGQWLRLLGSETLSIGDSFCLSDDQTAVFEVIDA
ncbi:MAG: protein kinase [Acidobacteriaceae bacterium]|nr:protein kinase [Acidobacteriaceae bacterium]MBV9778541.1 protein kinase [Acidobacteriaceae bacterium]